MSCPLISPADRDGSVENGMETSVHPTKAAIGRWTGVSRRRGPKRSPPARAASIRHATSAARESPRQMFAIPIPKESATPRTRNAKAGRSNPRRPASGERKGSAEPGLRGERLLDQHHRDVGDDRVHAPAGRAEEPFRHHRLLVLHPLAVLLHDVLRDVLPEAAERDRRAAVARGAGEDLEELGVDGHGPMLAGVPGGLFHFLAARRSRISPRSFTSADGSGAAAGAAGASFLSRLICLTRRKTAKATMRNSMQVFRKSP